MNPFTGDELRAMSEGVHAMYSAENFGMLCEHTFNLLRDLIPNEIALFDARSFRTGGCIAQFARLLADELNAGEHPLAFSPVGRFVLDRARPHFMRARDDYWSAPQINHLRRRRSQRARRNPSTSHPANVKCSIG